MSLILCAAMLAQRPWGFDPEARDQFERFVSRNGVVRGDNIVPAPPPPVQMSPTWTVAVHSGREDLEFQAAVEESILRSCKPEPPEAVRGFLRSMGDRFWRNRDAATRGLEAHCRAVPEDARWLLSARRSKEPEVAYRTNGVLRRLNPCRDCDGKGGSGGLGWQMECGRCAGVATEWTRGAWD